MILSSIPKRNFSPNDLVFIFINLTISGWSENDPMILSSIPKGNFSANGLVFKTHVGTT